jgi:hypothetical protein
MSRKTTTTPQTISVTGMLSCLLSNQSNTFSKRKTRVAIKDNDLLERFFTDKASKDKNKARSDVNETEAASIPNETHLVPSDNFAAPSKGFKNDSTILLSKNEKSANPIVRKKLNQTRKPALTFQSITTMGRATTR